MTAHCAYVNKSTEHLSVPFFRILDVMRSLPLTSADSVVTFVVLISVLLCTRIAGADNVKPFWTEKSSYIEGDKLYVVGIASGAPTVEAGRMQAFENGKNEIMNFTQISDLEGLVINTQMTYEDELSDRYNVYRLMYVDYEGVNALKNRSIEQTRRNYQRLQQKQEQEILIRRNALNQLSKYEEELALLDKEYHRIVSNVQLASDKALRYVKVGMSRLEVESLLGMPRSTYRHYAEYIFDSKYGNYWVIFDSADTVKCLSTGNKCVYVNCNEDNSRCAHQGVVSYFNRMTAWY